MYPTTTTTSDSPALPATTTTTTIKSKRPASPFRGSGPMKKRRVVLQQRPSVRFNEELQIYRPLPRKTPLLPFATWLKPQDLSKIRDGVFSTLDAMKRRRESGFDWSNNGGKYCSRGLEDYSIDQKGSLKASTIHRRQNSIRAVLHEQELQMRRHKELRWTKASKRNNKSTPRHHSILDHVKLSRVYRNQTESNIHDTISMGRIDSEQALAIYSEPPPSSPSSSSPQQQQQKRQRLRLPSLQSTSKGPNATTPNAKKPETTWGFATTAQPAAAQPDRPLRRLVSA